MKRLILIMVLMLPTLCWGSGIVNNSSSSQTAADSITIPFCALDSSGNMVALTTNDSVYISVWAPNGDSALGLAMIYTDSRIKRIVPATGVQTFAVKLQISALQGATARNGVYAYQVTVHDNSSANLMTPWMGFFQLYTTGDPNIKLDSITLSSDKSGYSLAAGGTEPDTSFTNLQTVAAGIKTQTDKLTFDGGTPNAVTANIKGTDTVSTVLHAVGVAACTTSINGDKTGYALTSEYLTKADSGATAASYLRAKYLEDKTGIALTTAYLTKADSGSTAASYLRAKYVEDKSNYTLTSDYLTKADSAATGASYLRAKYVEAKTGYSLASGGLDGVTQASGSVIFSNTTIGTVTDVTNPVGVRDTTQNRLVDRIWDEDTTGHGANNTMGWLTSQTASGGAGATLAAILNANLATWEDSSNAGAAFKLGTLLYIAGDTSGTIWSSLADLANRMADTLTDGRGVMQRHDVDPSDTAFIESAKINSIFDDVIALEGWNPLTDAIVVPVTNIEGDTILTINITYDANIDTVKHAIVVGMKKNVMADSNFNANAITNAKVTDDVAVTIVAVADGAIKSAGIHTDYWDSIAVLIGTGGSSVSLGALIADTASVASSGGNSNNYFLTTLETPMPYDKYLHQYMSFTSGDYDGFTRLIVADTDAALTIIPPLGGIPSAGDDFVIWAFANMLDSATFQSDYWAAIDNAGGGSTDTSQIKTMLDGYYDLFQKMRQLDSLWMAVGYPGVSISGHLANDLFHLIGAYTGIGTSNIKNAIEAVAVGGCSGTGTESCTLYVNLGDEGMTPIAGASIQIMNLAQTTTYGGPITTPNSGVQIFNLDTTPTGGYVVIITSQDYIPLTDTIVVNQDSTWHPVLVARAGWPSAPSDTSMCQVRVSTYDIAGKVVSGAEFTITPLAKGSTWHDRLGNLVGLSTLKAYTDALGMATLTVYRSRDVLNPIGDSLRYNMALTKRNLFDVQWSNRLLPDSSTTQLK